MDLELETLDRKHFEAHGTATALDYAAQLVHITSSMWELREQCKKWNFMGEGRAGNLVLEACRSAAIGLIEAATKRNPKAAIEDVRREHLPALREATKSSQKLAQREQMEIGQSGLMTKRVHRRLTDIVQQWEGTSASATSPEPPTSDPDA
jgi:hypothetical protein